MTLDKALQIAIQVLTREKRHKRQFFEMYRDGFEGEKPGYDKYIELEEAIKVLEELNK